MSSLAKYYIKDNTKGVIISYNLNYSPLNVNCTGEITFEFSPIGNYVTHKVDVNLFVLNYAENRQFLFSFEICLIVLNFILIFLFFNLMIDLKRSSFIGYIFFNKFG